MRKTMQKNLKTWRMKMKKLTKKQAKIIDAVNQAIHIEVKMLKDYIEENREEMVSHMQGVIKDKLSGIASYLIYSDDTKYNQNWKAVKEEFRAIQNMDVLKIKVWLDIIESGNAVSEEEYKLANA